MGVIVAIARSVLFCAFGMAARPVIVPGMVAGAVIVSRMRAGMIGARALARLDLQLAERRDDRRLVDALLVIFDADAARGAGVGLQHAGHLAQGLAHSAGAARWSNSTARRSEEHTSELQSQMRIS